MNEQMIEDELQHKLAEAIDNVIWPLADWDGDRLNASSAAGKAARAAHSVMAAKIAELEAALEAISSGEAFRIQRFAEDDDPEYFLRVQRYVQQSARYALARHRGTDQL